MDCRISISCLWGCGVLDMALLVDCDIMNLRELKEEYARLKQDKERGVFDFKAWMDVSDGYRKEGRRELAKEIAKECIREDLRRKGLQE